MIFLPRRQVTKIDGGSGLKTMTQEAGRQPRPNSFGYWDGAAGAASAL
jgi:hypothetical protein